MKLYVFKTLPPFLWGYTRDIRAMWAMKECGIKYEALGLDCGPNGLQDLTWYRAINPFNQVPVIDDDGYILTESGAILTYVAEKSGKLIPPDLKGRMQVQRWHFATLNSIEPFSLMTLLADMMGDNNPNMKGLRPWNVETLSRFLGPIDERLKDQPFIVGTDFTIADITLTGVLRELRKNEVLKSYPRVEDYRLRCQARPAFKETLKEYEERLGIPAGAAL